MENIYDVAKYFLNIDTMTHKKLRNYVILPKLGIWRIMEDRWLRIGLKHGCMVLFRQIYILDTEIGGGKCYRKNKMNHNSMTLT